MNIKVSKAGDIYSFVEVRQSVKLRFFFSPTVLISPIFDKTFEICQRDAIAPSYSIELEAPSASTISIIDSGAIPRQEELHAQAFLSILLYFCQVPKYDRVPFLSNENLSGQF